MIDILPGGAVGGAEGSGRGRDQGKVPAHAGVGQVVGRWPSPSALHAPYAVSLSVAPHLPSLPQPSPCSIIFSPQSPLFSLLAHSLVASLSMYYFTVYFFLSSSLTCL